jgi:hypothetical protein
MRKSILIARAFYVTAILSGLWLVVAPTGRAAPLSEDDKQQPVIAYRAVVARTAGMVSDPEAMRLAAAHGLQVLNVAWEDTGRYKDSAVGPNISDMTIQVQQQDPRTGKFQLTCMPVIRFPNFDDKSADIDPHKFFVLVGNERKGQPLQRVSLWQLLGNVRKYLNGPNSWKGTRTSLLAKRDTHVLVSAQACFLPVPKQGMAEFNPVLFNYQSVENDPAVLTILATREGTSVTVIDNKRDAFQAGGTWGQRLFFNQHGDRASMTGQRLSDFTAETKKNPATQKTPDAAGQKGLNMVLLIQVPLKQKKPMRFINDAEMSLPSNYSVDAIGGFSGRSGARSDVEAAVIGHGKVEGPFTELANLDIERDPAFPVRVTVQFYKATSNGVVSDQDMTEIKEQIDKVYAQADFVGSLVSDGATGRPTEYDGDKVQPPDWWDRFWERYQQNTGLSRDQVIDKLRQRFGKEWCPTTEQELARHAEQLALAGFGAAPGWGGWLIWLPLAILCLGRLCFSYRRRSAAA